jgi:ankyrin repeat protein
MYALEWASTNGVTELARKSLAASNRCKNENTISILHKAFLNSAANGHAEVTLLFLSQEEIDPSFQNEEGQTALGLSAANNHVNVVRLLLVVPGIAVNESDLKGRTPILNAVHSKSVENMTSLLRAKGLKIDVNREGRVDFQPKSPLSLASEYPEPDIAKLLLSSPAIHADQRGHNFQTALHWAANEGIEDTVKALLECGANPDPEDYEGNTPLFYATRRGNASIVRMLLEAGADPNHSGRYDDQPLNVARYFRCPEVERALLDCDRFDQALLRPPYRGKAWARRSFDPTADHP